MSTKDQVHSPALPESPSQAAEMPPADADADTDGAVWGFQHWSLMTKAVFLWQVAALGVGKTRPLSRRQIDAPADAFQDAMGQLVAAGIVAPVRRGRRQCWTDNASAAASRWVALMTGAKS